MRPISRCPDCCDQLDDNNRCWNCNKVWSIISKHYFKKAIKWSLILLGLWKIIDIIGVIEWIK